MNDAFHVAIIPDGNRRWARENGLKGYAKLYDIAIEGLVDISDTAFEEGVTHLTLWGSSHANLADRSSAFAKGIDTALGKNIEQFSNHPVIEKYDIHITIIGEWRESLSPATIKAFEAAMEKTAHRRGRNLTLLIDYSGDRERAAAVQSILDTPTDETPADQLLRSRSWTGHLPEVDLIIRTGSWTDPHNSAGFLSLLVDESQYAFPKVLWPDFTSENLHEIIANFHSRERRHGK